MIADLYLKNCLDCSRITTRNYSTSFSGGIIMLDNKFHAPIYAIYGFVRYADEIVDTFFQQPREELLKKFKEETFQSIRLHFSTNPILHSFQWVVNTYHIDHALIEAFLTSMEMDLDKKDYTPEEFSRYVYGSAEVVGLMCLKVFCNETPGFYDTLLLPARKLGEAFQKVNFLRDIKSDYIDRGRVYFPFIDYNNFTEKEKKALTEDIEKDFIEANNGIKKLNKSSRYGVYLAYRYYLLLLKRINKTTANELKNKRIRVPDACKYWLFLQLLAYKMIGITLVLVVNYLFMI